MSERDNEKLTDVITNYKEILKQDKKKRALNLKKEKKTEEELLDQQTLLERAYQEKERLRKKRKEPSYEGTKELLESLSREKMPLLLEKIVEPDGLRQISYTFFKDLNKIFSLFQEQSTDKITFQRQYLPEILSPDLIEISEDDGLPTIKPFVIEIFQRNGIRIIFSDTEVQFKLDVKDNLIKLKDE